MKTMTGLILALFTTAVFSTPVVLTSAENKAVVQGVSEMATAFRNQNYKVSVDKMPSQFFTHFKTNRGAMLEVAKKSMAKLKELGFKVTAYTHDKPANSYQCKLSKVVFVPVKMIMTNGPKKLVSQSFLVVSQNENSKTWDIVDGAGARHRKLFDILYGCKGLAISMPPYSVKQM